MSGEAMVQMARRDHVITISVCTDRLSDALAIALDRALLQLRAQPEAAIVVFRGLGAVSVSDEPATDIRQDVDATRRWTKALTDLERLAIPSIAIIDGTCSSVGLELALSCDYRLATDRSGFVVSELRSGHLPGVKTFSLPKVVGMAIARRMVLLGEPLLANQALAVGLVDKVCSPEELTAVTEAVAGSLLQRDPDVVRLAKQLLVESSSAAPENVLGLFLAAQRRCLSRQSTAAGDEASLLASAPILGGKDLHVDLQIALPWLRQSDARVQELDPKRSATKGAAGFALREAARSLRTAFFGHHARTIYSQLCEHDTPRLDALVYSAAERFPGLLPSRERIASLTGVLQMEKDDAEIDQASFIAELLSQPDIGAAVVDAMRTTKPASLAHLDTFQRTDRLDLGAAHLERRGNVGHVSIANRSCLNAENEPLLEALEICADVALLDSRIEVCVLRGDVVEHEKYRGRRVFCSGINLTDLFNGRISYLYFVLRELGFVNKVYRGLRADSGEIRKPWVMAVDAHAIGGGCQLLLVSDYVVAERGARFSVPAQREGFIPGAANLRLARFVGPRLARELLYMNRTLIADGDGAGAAGLADEVVASEAMDDAIARAAATLANRGPVSFAGNQRMMRLGEEPDEVFREYMANFARTQARALFAPELIRNLEHHWTAR
jgi:thioesterase DpgC